MKICKSLIGTLLGVGVISAAWAQARPAPTPMPAASTASMPASATMNSTNKAGKPSVDAAASSSGVANKKPAKPGAQSGPASAPGK